MRRAWGLLEPVHGGVPILATGGLLAEGVDAGESVRDYEVPAAVRERVLRRPREVPAAVPPECGSARELHRRPCEVSAAAAERKPPATARAPTVHGIPDCAMKPSYSPPTRS